VSKNKEKIELSPGKKLRILSNFWLINTEYFKHNPPRIENAYNKNKIFSLDEADNHMHPRLIRDFMNILKNRDIHYLDFQDFMTTHNPITVTFTPKENLFEMKYENGGYSIEKVNFRRHGLKALNNDLVPSFSYKPIKIVYVEGMDDLHFFL
jgi:predicted ATP-dependent endonuclease of OLD family